MPEPLHPPYNVVQPRQLNRWLDVNSQNGPLTRTRGFISVPFNTIPVIPLVGQKINFTNNTGGGYNFILFDINGNTLQTLNIANGAIGVFTDNLGQGYGIARLFFPVFQSNLPFTGWTGNASCDGAGAFTFTLTTQVADKVLQFNFQATKNFSILIDENLDQLVDYCQGMVTLYVANVIKNGNSFNIVKRYRLTDPAGEINDVPQYKKQPLLGTYFQIEVWTLSNFTGNLNPSPNAFVLNTSILGNLDYRFGTDFSVHTVPGQIVTNFQNNNPNAINLYNLPLTFNQNTINGVN